MMGKKKLCSVDCQSNVDPFEIPEKYWEQARKLAKSRKKFRIPIKNKKQKMDFNPACAIDKFK